MTAEKYDLNDCLDWLDHWTNDVSILPSFFVDRLISIREHLNTATPPPLQVNATEHKSPCATQDQINHPSHYNNHPSGIECIQITRHMNFNLGNAIKYLWRAGLKGAEAEDLKKAIWYINDEINRLGAKNA